MRNAIHQCLTRKFGKENWYDEFETIYNLSDFKNEINEAKSKLIRRKEQIDSGKMVAEFTLGFWVKMFNRHYETELWKTLRFSFTNLPKKERQLHNVASRINKMRTFRNRVYHYEPVLWSFDKLEENYKNIIQLLTWLDVELPVWVNEIDRFKNVLKTTKANLLNP